MKKTAQHDETKESAKLGDVRLSKPGETVNTVTPKKAMRRKVMRAIALVFLAAGLVVLIFPYLLQWRYAHTAEAQMEAYSQQREEWKESGYPFDLQDLLAAMKAYNEDLYLNGQVDYKDAWSYQPASFDLTKWGLDENIVACLDIPSMGVKLPVYLGATAENMNKGAVHLTETSLPIGGENANCVVAAHRGYYAAAMFRDIEDLQLGDEIKIENLWETLAYQVVEIKVIHPNDTDETLIQEGRDLVTLITCHPYGYNYQRYVVYCERILP